MKLVESRFADNDTSVQALTARHVTLSKEIDTQKQKIAVLKSALENASTSFGETNRRTQNWQIQLNHASAALNDMERDLKANDAALESASKEMNNAGKSADGMKDSVKKTGEESEKASEKISALGAVCKATAAVIGTALAVAGAAALTLGKQVVSAYGEYEQAVGGIETLFKESSAQMQQYAFNAYKTSGLSANEYMETVTAFSASLISSLGGDTEKAARYADMAITDMADNANKLGTSITSVQAAYRGFAKQMYSMLDNLKLGYGGTRSEMERLLSDAEKLSGVHYDINSYSDVVEAIHVIQTSMGIAGSSAIEAEHTIEGSIGALTASLQNLLIGLGDAHADIHTLCKGIVTEFKNVVTNVTPVLRNIVSVLPDIIGAVITAAGELLPELLTAVTDLFDQVLNTLLTLLPGLMPAVTDALLTIVDTILDKLPLFLNTAVQIVSTLANGIASALPKLLPTAVKAVVAIVKGLIDSLPQILDAAIVLVDGLAEGILSALPILVDALPEIMDSIVGFLLDGIPKLIDTGILLLTSLIAALPQTIAKLSAAMPRLVTGLSDAILGCRQFLVEMGPKLFISLIKDLPAIIVELAKAMPQIVVSLAEAIGKEIVLFYQVGRNLVYGMWDGIKSLSAWIGEKLSEWAKELWGRICDFFGIHSPSRRMAWIGDMLMEGLAGGIDHSAMDAISSATDMTNQLNRVFNGISADMTATVPERIPVAGLTHTTPTPSAEGGFSLQLNITNFNNYTSEDIETLTQEVMETAAGFLTQKGAVFA